MFSQIRSTLAAALASALASTANYAGNKAIDPNGAFGGSRPTKPTFYKTKARAKFKAQRIARRAQRKGA